MVGRRKEDLFTKLKKYLPEDIDPKDFTDDRHWSWKVKGRKRLRIRYNGVDAHPTWHLMEHEQVRGKLHPHQHRLIRDCSYIHCINPRHHHIVANRELLGITPYDLRVYNETQYLIPIFSWQDTQEQTRVVSVEELIEALEYELNKIDHWKRIPADQLLAQIGQPDFTVEMIRSLQQP